MSDAQMPDLVIEAHGTVTLPPGWHFDGDGNAIKDETPDREDAP